MSDRLTVVNIGAAPIDGAPPYVPLLSHGLCTVYGFEPQDEQFDELVRRSTEAEHYYPYAIGDGEDHVLNICRAPGMSSLLTPDPLSLALFQGFDRYGQAVDTERVYTIKLDDISEIHRVDYLCMDVQGAELMVLQNGRNKLTDAVCVHLEVPFVPLYRNQPTFGDIDNELRAQGFIPHMFASAKAWPVGKHHKPINQLIDGDAVYIRDIRNIEAFSDRSLWALATIMRHCYHSIDVADLCQAELDRRAENAASN